MSPLDSIDVVSVVIDGDPDELMKLVEGADQFIFD